jgi:hypothetical protein
MFKKWLKRGVLALGVVLIAIQLVPYGRDHRNPPVVLEPTWSSPEVRALAVRACFDCHSNQTVWPWYSNVAPISWLIQNHTLEGRQVLNFSEWNRPQREAGESAETVLKGEMPPASYLPLHPDAVLSPAERSRLAEGLTATLRGAEQRSRPDD